MASQSLLNIVVAGHVDHGKSTLIGRLLLDTRSLPKGKLAEIRKISRELGKETELAYLTDQLKEEREHSMTIDTAQIFFKTRKRNYCIIDAPGHAELIKNMITGASLADAAVLIVDAAEGIREQTTRHAYIIGMLGMDTLIVVLNKMDLAGYKKEKFEQVKTELLRSMQSLKLKPLFLIPVSAREGVNICKRPAEMSWYKGPFLLQALDSIKPRLEDRHKPLRFAIQDIYTIDGQTITAGKVLSGRIAQGQSVAILPGQKETKIGSIKTFEKFPRKAGTGENIGLIVDCPVKRGQIISEKNNTPMVTRRFKADIFWISEIPLNINTPLILRCSTQAAPCRITNIEQRIDSSTLAVIEKNARTLNYNEIAGAEIETEQAVVLDNFRSIAELGRIVIEQNNIPLAAGIITQTSG